MIMDLTLVTTLTANAQENTKNEFDKYKEKLIEIGHTRSNAKNPFECESISVVGIKTAPQLYILWFIFPSILKYSFSSPN